MDYLAGNVQLVIAIFDSKISNDNVVSYVKEVP